MNSRLRTLILALLASTLCIGAARASTISYSATVPLQVTDWATSLDFPKFDPMAGTLGSVTVVIVDSLVHKIEFENQSPSAGSLFRDSTYVTVDVMRPASTALVEAVSKVYKTATVGVSDGVLDYAGTSGVTFDGLVSSTTWSSTTSAAVDLALFTGAGTISLPCQASALFVFGYTAGNAKYIATTQALARVTVTYTYDAATPATRAAWGRVKALYR